MRRAFVASSVLDAALVTAALAAIVAAAPQVGIPGSDKLHHFLAFAALAFPLSVVRPQLAPWVVLGVIGYGGLIELTQPFLGRHAEWADLLADAGGAILGAAVGSALAVGRWRD